MVNVLKMMQRNIEIATKSLDTPFTLTLMPYQDKFMKYSYVLKVTLKILFVDKFLKIIKINIEDYENNHRNSNKDLGCSFLFVLCHTKLNLVDIHKF